MQSGRFQVFGSFRDREQLERALNRLKQEGFTGEQISMLAAHSEEGVDAGVYEDAAAGEGAAAGLGTGAILGGALGWLVGAGVLAIPGLGPFFAAGPLASLLVGATAGGTLGGLSGALLGLGLSEDQAQSYEERSRKGESLVSISCADTHERDRAVSALKQNGAAHVSAVSRGAAADEEQTSEAGDAQSLSSQIEVDNTAIERRAYEIWQSEGRPPGKEMEHWARAERELRRS